MKNKFYRLNLKYSPLYGIWKVAADSSYTVRHSRGLSRSAFFITTGGQGSLQTGNNLSQLLNPYSVWFIPRQQPCFYFCAGEKWSFYFIELNNDSLLHTLNLDFHKKYMLPDFYYTRHICAMLIREIILQNKGYQYKAVSLLYELLVYWTRIFNPTRNIRELAVQQAVQWMHTNINKKLKTAVFYKNSGLSRTSFFTLFKKRYETAPADYFLNLKLANACRTLLHTSKKIKIVAAENGFSDSCYFSRFFKKKYGYAPSVYRKKNQEFSFIH